MLSKRDEQWLRLFRLVQLMNEIVNIYEALYAHYGNLNWWPAETPYEVMVGAVLTQNTNWGNVEKALANWQGNLSPEGIIASSHEELINIIRPAGFFNQKARYLKELTEWYKRYDFDFLRVRKEPLETLRAQLLCVKGIGKETADSILLYAFEFPTFVVDAYTVRFCARFAIDAGKTYDDIKTFFEARIPQEVELYKNYHALIVINGKNHCKKRPQCNGCPLYGDCKYSGLAQAENSK